MNLDIDLYQRMAAIEWLSRAGEASRPELGFPVRWVEDRKIALQSKFSTEWADATTHAKGRLTGYLAKQDYSTYGTTWNKLAKQSRALLEKTIKAGLSTALDAGAWATSLARIPLPEVTPTVQASIGKRMADLQAARAWEQCLSVAILLDVNLAAMELTYRRDFRKAPIFFERLLLVYEVGRLPCGWDGDLDSWPRGRLIVF